MSESSWSVHTANVPSGCRAYIHARPAARSAARNPAAERTVTSLPSSGPPEHTPAYRASPMAGLLLDGNRVRPGRRRVAGRLRGVEPLDLGGLHLGQQLELPPFVLRRVFL